MKVSELRSCVKDEKDVLGFQSLTVRVYGLCGRKTTLNEWWILDKKTTKQQQQPPNKSSRTFGDDEENKLQSSELNCNQIIVFSASEHSTTLQFCGKFVRKA